MKARLLSRLTAAAMAAAIVLGAICPAAFAALPTLRGDGARIVDSSGKPVILCGCNLGNWLLLEPWMQKWDIEDQQAILRSLTERFGAEKTHELMESYRTGYITPRDFELIKTFGFNVVRVPFESLLLIDERGQMRPDAFKWLDRALEMAENAGMYVILDMHGAPGRQSSDACTGERGQNRLWADPVSQQRMVELWTQIAQRYKNRSVVAAYDLLNEPFADYRTDVRVELRDLMGRCYRAVRSTGDSHLIIFPAALGSSVAFYGDVEAEGMTQVAFTDHYYAGLFGSPATIDSHARMFARKMPQAAAYLERVGSPMLIGEFNVVLEQSGGEAMMRHYFDEFARRGWMATMWSHKLLKPAGGVEPDNWYMVTNAEPISPIDVRSSSLEDVERYMKNLPTMPLAVDQKLRSSLTDKVAPSMPLPQLEPLPQSAPAARAAGQWKLLDIATDAAGGVSDSSGELSIVAAGIDIFGQQDSFSFLQQPVTDSATITATIAEFTSSGIYAKAGLMLRFGDPESPDYAAAPFVMIHVFPDGVATFTVRDRPGAAASETKRIVGPLPRKLSLVRDQSRIDAYVDDGRDAWIKLGSAQFADAGAAQAGVAVCSHQAGLLTRATVRQLSLVASSKSPAKISDHANPAAPAGRNLVRNPSFEQPRSSGLAEAWNHWGAEIARQELKGAAHSGQAAITCPAGNAGAWQDVTVQPGKTYAFAVFARRDDRTPPQRQTVAVSLEATIEGKQVVLDERSCGVDQLNSIGGWSLLRVTATSISDTMRVLVRLTPSDEPQAAITFDDASLTQIDD